MMLCNCQITEIGYAKDNTFIIENNDTRYACHLVDYENWDALYGLLMSITDFTVDHVDENGDLWIILG